MTPVEEMLSFSVTLKWEMFQRHDTAVCLKGCSRCWRHISDGSGAKISETFWCFVFDKYQRVPSRDTVVLQFWWCMPNITHLCSWKYSQVFAGECLNLCYLVAAASFKDIKNPVVAFFFYLYLIINLQTERSCRTSFTFMFHSKSSN